MVRLSLSIAQTTPNSVPRAECEWNAEWNAAHGLYYRPSWAIESVGVDQRGPGSQGTLRVSLRVGDWERGRGRGPGPGPVAMGGAGICSPSGKATKSS